MNNDKLETLSLKKYVDLAIKVATIANIKNPAIVGISIIKQYEKMLHSDTNHISMAVGYLNSYITEFKEQFSKLLISLIEYRISYIPNNEYLDIDENKIDKAKCYKLHKDFLKWRLLKLQCLGRMFRNTSPVTNELSDTVKMIKFIGETDKKTTPG